MTAHKKSRVCSTLKDLEKLIMDVTARDLNLQMQQLISDYKKTGDEKFKIDAEYLRSEYQHNEIEKKLKEARDIFTLGKKSATNS